MAKTKIKPQTGRELTEANAKPKITVPKHDKPDFPPDEQMYLNQSQAAKYLGVSTTLIAKLPVPRCRISERAVRYDRRALDAWMQSKKEEIQ